MYAPHARATSTAFLEAYRRCMTAPVSGPETEMMFMPALICAAFSAEVGLKALLLQANKPVRGHDLFKLFNDVPGEYKLEIVRLVGMAPEDFARNLSQIRDAFPEWRYMYEFEDERAISVDFVARFAAAVATVNPLNQAAV